MPKVGLNVYKLSILTIATKLEDAHISYYLLVSLLFVAEINSYSPFLNSKFKKGVGIDHCNKK